MKEGVRNESVESEIKRKQASHEKNTRPQCLTQRLLEAPRKYQSSIRQLGRRTSYVDRRHSHSDSVCCKPAPLAPPECGTMASIHLQEFHIAVRHRFDPLTGLESSAWTDPPSHSNRGIRPPLPRTHPDTPAKTGSSEPRRSSQGKGGTGAAARTLGEAAAGRPWPHKRSSRSLCWGRRPRYVFIIVPAPFVSIEADRRRQSGSADG